MKEKLRQLKYWWNCHTSGLEEFVEDVRDLDIRDLFGDVGAYKPKYTRRDLAPVFEKDQLRKENCSFQTASRVLSVYFGENVSVRWLVAKAWQQGLCNENGGAQLRNWCKVAQKYGVMFEKDLPTDDSLPWAKYVDLPFAELDPLAAKNKIGSYYRVRNVDEYLKCIDEGYAVALGRYWYSSYNRGGGFTEPWILTTKTKEKGFKTGAHATAGIGYDLTKGTDIEANSYSNRWGDKGFFYCELDQLQQDMNTYGGYAITKVPYTPKEVKLGLMAQALDLLSQLVEMLKKKEMSLKDIIEKYIGQDASPKDLAPDRLACAETVTTILKEYLAQKDINFPVILGTADLYKTLLSRTDLFKKLEEPVTGIWAGDIVISPTDGDNIGHTGFYLNATDIVSNSSLEPNSGKFIHNYTRTTWRNYYHYYKGLPVYIFRVLV